MIILTVQPHSNGQYRLGISKEDSLRIFRKRKTKAALNLNGHIIHTQTTCGPSDNPDSSSNKKGFDLCDRGLSDWIKTNNYHIYPDRNPTKLSFEILGNRTDGFVLKKSNSR
jgi:hypothetical protein